MTSIKFRNPTGFTLAEMAMVCAILGMIVMLCWPAVRGVSKRLIGKSEANQALLKHKAGRERAALNGEKLPHAP